MLTLGSVILFQDAEGLRREHIDVKEGASGTILEFCTFNGTGISGANSADSFMDVKGVNSIARCNQGLRNGNSNVLDVFQGALMVRSMLRE